MKPHEMPWKWVSGLRQRRGRIIGAMALLAALALPLVAQLALCLVPLPEALFTGQISQVEFVDCCSRPLRAVTADRGPFQRLVGYGQIPQALVQATVAAEDRRFWVHPGVDWRSSARAVWQLAANRRVVSGASTISQQVIKLAKPRPRTVGTKLIEAVQALRLEQVWDKQRILTEYLNRLDYGHFNRGCAAAAQFYFGKPLTDLSSAESAFLAGLPQGPSRLNPYAHFERARKRQHWILGQMRRGGMLSEDQWLRAVREPLPLVQPRRSFEAPHFVELLIAADPERWTRSGLPRVVPTTIDLELNRFTEQLLRTHLEGLRSERVSNGAVVVLDNRSGDVLALVGSENFFAPAAGQVNGAWACRSAGSTLKPFTYLLAFERGANPASIAADVPTEITTATGLFAPMNYNRQCHGPIRYRLALANSLNIPAVKVLASIGGPRPLQQWLQRCGLSTLGLPAEEYGLGLTIGNAETRLLELANAYACLARLGSYKPWRMLLNEKSPGVAQQLADPAAAYLVADILTDNAARELCFGTESPLRFNFPVACKTGTSSDFRDNWAFGYTPEFTVGVWVGNFDGSPMRQVSGVTGAAPILHDLFERLHDHYGTTWFSAPPDVVECRVHPLTGKRCLGTHLLDGTAAVVEKCLASKLPPMESPDDYAPDPGGRLTLRLSPEYREWLATTDTSFANSVTVASVAHAPRIIFPPSGTIFYLDPDLPEQGRRVRLRAAGSEGLRWESDSLQISASPSGCTVLIAQGRHLLSVVDPATGVRAQTAIEVHPR